MNIFVDCNITTEEQECTEGGSVEISGTCTFTHTDPDAWTSIFWFPSYGPATLNINEGADVEISIGTRSDYGLSYPNVSTSMEVAGKLQINVNGGHFLNGDYTNLDYVHIAKTGEMYVKQTNAGSYVAMRMGGAMTVDGIFRMTTDSSSNVALLLGNNSTDVLTVNEGATMVMDRTVSSTSALVDAYSMQVNNPKTFKLTNPTGPLMTQRTAAGSQL